MVVKGAVPTPEPLGPGKDACCQEAKPHDRSLLVGPEGGLANVVVTLETRRGEREPRDLLSPLDPSTGELAAYVLTNKGCAFEPRVLVVRTGCPLVLANDDPTMHNVNIDFVRNPGVNVVVEPDGRREIVLKKTEPKPVPVRCNVHTFMAGWVVVRDNVTTASVSNNKGEFQLYFDPRGEWRLRFWHEGKALEGLQVAGSKTDRRGDVLVTVPEEGTLDLGKIVIPIERL
ncbi:hypothetical protein MalM25_18170 [Planctomycetes bacterium MalM25]|nr:hypothetical protein MalM25_18170 [Planctomycetes bacterium MalM25]